jgi:dTDP-4-amino-4,6-dideoxygalactose transaminase
MVKIMKIPFVDLKIQYQSIKTDIDKAIQNVINETAFIKGKYVHKFEENYKQAYGVKHVISCANGTDAIYITLKALGIGPGDEVITVANTWISTAETISQTGAKPVFIDIDPDYYTIDVNQIEEKITNKTKAIIPVHLFGQPADMDAITTICKKYDLFLVEDCAQAHFAEWSGQKVGTIGNAGTFSFFPGKNLGAYGDAGAIITNDDLLADKMRMFANHGALKKHFHEIEGINSRMDGLQAAILSVKLQYITAWSKARYLNALKYSEYLKDINEIILPKIHPNVKHVFHLYVVRVKRRSELQVFLKDLEVSTGIHYPKPLPFLKAYKYLDYKTCDIPVASDYMNQILSLPMYPELNTRQIKSICSSISRFFTM